MTSLRTWGLTCLAPLWEGISGVVLTSSTQPESATAVQTHVTTKYINVTTKYDVFTNLRLDVIDGGFGPGPIMCGLDGLVHTRRPQLSWTRLAEEGDDDEVDGEDDQVAHNTDGDLQAREENK